MSKLDRSVTLSPDAEPYPLVDLSMPELISVTSETVHSVLPELPRLVRMALGFGSKLKHGTLDVTLPDGRTVRLGGNGPGPAAAMKVDNFGFASRLLRSGDIGIAEAYLRGDWDTPDLTQFLYLFCVNQDWMQTMLVGKPMVRYLQIIRHWFNRNTKWQARRNIYAHYDIGNAFYSAWLDPSMTYSSALFEDGTADLTAAQTNKYRRLAEAIDLQPGQRLLEIGCGWGGFAEYAAKHYGVRVVGLTISKEQRDFAQRRIQNAGLADQVEIRLRDYRDEREQYDRIASIEMIEAVGEEFWPRYFSQLRDRLLPGGLAGIQAITIQDRLFQAYRREVDFIQRYVFPGGMLPSPQILKSLGERFGVPVIRERIFGQDYAKTLVSWRKNFREAWPNLMPLGFDDRFRRLWEYYLAYCEAGFLSGNIDVRQVIFAKSE
jgi:cyclopropane-fatty-acyl-phospholipid synthase